MKQAKSSWHLGYAKQKRVDSYAKIPMKKKMNVQFVDMVYVLSMISRYFSPKFMYDTITCHTKEISKNYSFSTGKPTYEPL